MTTRRNSVTKMLGRQIVVVMRAEDGNVRAAWAFGGRNAMVAACRYMAGARHMKVNRYAGFWTETTWLEKAP